MSPDTPGYRKRAWSFIKGRCPNNRMCRRVQYHVDLLRWAEDNGMCPVECEYNKLFHCKHPEHPINVDVAWLVLGDL